MKFELAFLLVLSGIIFLLVILLFIQILKSKDKAYGLFVEWKKQELEEQKETIKKLLHKELELEKKEWQQSEEKNIRKDAINKSKNVIHGQVSEQLLPFLPEFQYNPKDARFLGSPLDLIVFDGLSEGKLREIIFIEVKAGEKAQLTPREKQIKECLQSLKVRYQLLRLQGANKAKAAT